MLDSKFRSDRTWTTHVITRPAFTQNRGLVVSALERARQDRADPVKVLQLQAEQANELIHLQTAQRELKKKLAADLASDEDKESLDVAKALAFVIKQNADGIAWRSLDYDRGMIHELAYAPQTGHMQIESAVAELEQAALIVGEFGLTVLLNDLTNFLRCGDLTCISPSFADIVEVKSGTGSAKSGRASRQRQRRVAVIEFISRRERVTSGGVQKLLRLSTTPVSYVPGLRDLIATARSTGSAHARLSDALAVQVFDAAIMAERGELTPDQLENPFAQSSEAMIFTNVDHFGRFSPNLAPFSVFPLSAEDCVALMTGELFVLTYLNRGNIFRALKRRDLRLRVPTEAELRALPQDIKPGEVPKYELACPIIVSDPRRSLHISLGEIARIAYHLLDEDCYAEATCELLARPVDQEELVYWSFEREADLWD